VGGVLNIFCGDPVHLQLRRAGFHPSHRVGQVGFVFLGRGRARDHRRPRHAVGRLVHLGDVLPDARHHLRTLGRGLLGDARGANGRGDTGEVGHLLTSVFHVDRLGVHSLFTVRRGVEGALGRPEDDALLGVHVVRGGVHCLYITEIVL